MTLTKISLQPINIKKQPRFLRWRKKMIKLTANAKKELDAFFADKEKSTIRVFLAPGG